MFKVYNILIKILEKFELQWVKTNICKHSESLILDNKELRGE